MTTVTMVVVIGTILTGKATKPMSTFAINRYVLPILLHNIRRPQKLIQGITEKGLMEYQARHDNFAMATGILGHRLFVFACWQNFLFQFVLLLTKYYFSLLHDTNNP